MASQRLSLDPESLAVESFSATSKPGETQLPGTSVIHDTVLRSTEWISCFKSDCGTCGGTDCWV